MAGRGAIRKEIGSPKGTGICTCSDLQLHVVGTGGQLNGNRAAITAAALVVIVTLPRNIVDPLNTCSMI